MKITIFYFSGTGSTWYVANSLAEAINNKGVQAEAISIEKINQTDSEKAIKESDKIVLGFPIYCSAAPRNMEQFIDNLPQEKGKPVSVFTTVALYSGDGTIHYRKLLQRKGYAFEAGMEFVMHSNLNVPGFPDMFKPGDEEKIALRNENAIAKAKQMAEAIISGQSKTEGGGFFGRFTGISQRIFYDMSIKMLNKKLLVKHDKCIKCMRCVKMCPVENIKFEDGKIQIGDNCMACMRCYHFCPTAAINCTEKSFDIKKWPRFKGPTKDYIKTLL
ncbi:MAG: EFR1 family ferrodoxin [Clostridia bacterium]|nr:EFR1 family ferrodoxin [Clostridia bacterium]